MELKNFENSPERAKNLIKIKDEQRQKLIESASLIIKSPSGGPALVKKAAQQQKPKKDPSGNTH